MKLGVAGVAVLLSLAACDRLMPPPTTEPPCPKRCATGGCCGYDEECRADGCAFVGDVGARAKDAGP